MVRTRKNTSTNPNSGAKEAKVMEIPKKDENPANKVYEKKRRKGVSKGVYYAKRKGRKEDSPGAEITAAKKMKIREGRDSQSAETVVPPVVSTASCSTAPGETAVIPYAPVSTAPFTTAPESSASAAKGNNPSKKVKFPEKIATTIEEEVEEEAEAESGDDKEEFVEAEAVDGDDGKEKETVGEESGDVGDTPPLGTEETERESANLDSRDVLEEMTALKPVSMYFPPSEYSKSVKISTRCYFEKVMKTFENMNLTKREKSWFNNHEQFCHFFHMPKEGHKVQHMWMLLLRTAKIEKHKELWFVVNGVPIRYGLREHALMSGLNCRNYPLQWRQLGSMDFVKRHFKGRVTMELVKDKLEAMEPDRNGERLRMAVLYFLCSIVYSPTKQGKDAAPVLDTFLRLVDDLSLCETFPWGRLSFELMLESIKSTLLHYNGVAKGNCAIPGLCTPLEVLAVEAIPILKERFRVPNPDACDDCPRMCKYQWRKSDMKGFPLEIIYEKLGNTKDIDSLVVATEEEKAMLDEITEEDEDVDVHDPVIESWTKRINKGFTIQFEDMLAEDLLGRVPKDEEKEENAASASNEGQAGNTSLTEMVNVVKTLGEEMKTMGEEMKGLVDKLDGLDRRMVPLEAYVKERTRWDD